MNSPNPVAALPEGAPEENTEQAGEPAGFDFADLASHDDLADAPEANGKGEEVVAAAAEPAQPASSPAEGTPPAPTPPVAPAEAVAQPPTPPTEVPVQPPVPPVQEAPVAAAPAVPELSFEQHREKFLPQLAKLYELPEAEVEELRVNPGVALPKMAARLHYEVQMATHQGILNVLPQIVEGMMKSQMKSTEYENQFFGAWPRLKEAVASNPKAHEAIVTSIQSFRQLNPKASTADIIARAGMLACMTLGLPVETVAQAPVAPVVPQVPARPPGIGATGHIPAATPGGGEEGDIIAELSAAHLRGDI